ncbi:MAG: insulinase family protein [Deltaproteobacteria bacterium]|nr:insulinase family protein [Deltaproteobacteria bacterium]
MKALYQNQPAVPLTAVSLVLPRTGVCLEPPGLQGVTRLALRMIFRGAGAFSNEEYNSRLERLGATVGAGLGSDYVSFKMLTLTDNLDQALELFALALDEPRFDSGEFERLQGELISSWKFDRQESKRLRALEVYHREIYQGRPQGYLSDGTLEGLQAAGLDDVRAQFRLLRETGRPVVAMVSNLPREELLEKVSARLGATVQTGPEEGREQSPHPWDDFEPPVPAGRRVVIIPDRDTNTDEIILGAFSTAQTDPQWHLHQLIELVFGGDMNSRLFRIIRGERGLSYGASCWYEAGRGRTPRNQRAPFTLYTFPSAEHTAQAVPLLLEMYEELVRWGITPEELERARMARINSHPFHRDTPQKLLNLALEELLYGVRVDDEESNRKKLEAVDAGDLLKAIRKDHDPRRALLVMLGDPERLLPIAESLPDMEKIEEMEYP